MKNPAIYQGLFLIFVALFAAERQKNRSIPEANAETVIVQNEGSPTLFALYPKLKSLSVFQSQIEGLAIAQKPHEIVISLQEDDLYTEGEVAVNENWRAILDQLTTSVFPELTPHYQVEIVGFANSLSEKERVSVAMTKSPWVFSAKRAEWVLQYIDGRISRASSPKLTISGAGAVPNGKRLEIRIRDLE